MTFATVDPRANIRRYLNRETASRVAIKNNLDVVVERLNGTMIFGGMLRDFALKRGGMFVSDIDLVTMSAQNEIRAAIAPFCPAQNKFGGFRFAVGKTLFDIWAFEDTWAFRQGLVEGKRLEDLLKTTFFNVDAAAYALSSGKFYYADGWVEAIESRLLDINLPQNVSVQGMMKRAIKLACGMDFSIGGRLARFMVRNINLRDLDRVGCTFMLDLKRHVESGLDTPYSFDPQRSFLPD